MAKRMRNPQTGEVVELQGNKWVPVSPEQVAAEETGTVGALGKGAWHTVSQVGRGVGNLFAPGEPFTMSPEDQAAYAALQQEHPIATAVGESAPYMVGGLGAGMALRGAGLAANVMGQGAVGGALGVSQPGTAGERLERGAIDAALGAGGEVVGRGIGRVFAPRMNAARGNLADTLGQAEDVGYNVLPSTRMPGAQNLRQTIEGKLEATPGGSMAMNKKLQGNQALLNTHAAEAIGENADEVSSPVLAHARKRIGGVFNRLMTRDRPVPVDDALRVQIAQIEDEAINPFVRGEADPIGAAVERLRKHLADGSIDAKTLMSIQSRLGKQGRQALRGESSNPDLGHGLLDIQDALLEQAGRAMKPDEIELFSTARQQYKALSNLQSGLITDPVSGDVSAAKLANFLQRRDRVGFTEGGNRSDLYTGTRLLGRAQKKLGTSGTAERMSGLGTIGGLIGYAGADENELLGAAGGALAGAAAPYALARAYLSPAMRNMFTRAPGFAEQQATRAVGLTGAQMAPQLGERSPLLDELRSLTPARQAEILSRLGR